MAVAGILNINKSAGMTSFSVVAAVRRQTGERHAGHTGTLDPEATGVLLVCLGQATRVVEYMMDYTKAYRVRMELGLTTDTYDASGSVVQRRDSSQVDRGRVESALASFKGQIQQTPPMYSAVKRRGRPLYELARAGITVDRPSRSVEILECELVDWHWPVATVEVVCGKGAYIRSLVNDVGEVLGCGAIVRELVRLRCGPFHLDSAVTLEQLEAACRQGDWQELLYPVDSVLSDWESVIVDDETARAIRNGRQVSLGNSEECYPISSERAGVHYCRAYTEDRSLLALLYFDTVTQLWQPKKVFH